MAGRLLLAGPDGATRDALAAVLIDLGWTVAGEEDGCTALILTIAAADRDVPVAAIERFAGGGGGGGADRSVVLLIEGPDGDHAQPGLAEAAVPGLARAAAPRARVNALRAPRPDAPGLAAALALLLGNRALTGQTIRL